MKSRWVVRGLLLFAVMALAPEWTATYAVAQSTGAAKAGKPTEIRIANAPIPIRILVQSPAETDTELQIICLFRSEPSNTLHGSLVETNEKLKGLLDRIRTPALFRGELGETMLVDPPAGSLAAKRLLIIGLGEAQTFLPERMELVGSIVYREANRLGVRHPFFAPTVIDGGVSGFNTGAVAGQVVSGFLRAARTEKIVRDAGASHEPLIQELTFLAGPQHAAEAQQGIEKAIAAAAGR
jgi:hypothetical protein